MSERESEREREGRETGRERQREERGREKDREGERERERTPVHKSENVNVFGNLQARAQQCSALHTFRESPTTDHFLCVGVHGCEFVRKRFSKSHTSTH